MYLPRMDFVTRGYQGSKMSVQGAGRNSARKPRIPGESGVKRRLGWHGDGAAQTLETPARLRPAEGCSWARWAPDRILAFPKKEDEHSLCASHYPGPWVQ